MLLFKLEKWFPKIKETEFLKLFWILLFCSFFLVKFWIKVLNACFPEIIEFKTFKLVPKWIKSKLTLYLGPIYPIKIELFWLNFFNLIFKIGFSNRKLIPTKIKIFLPVVFNKLAFKV